MPDFLCYADFGGPGRPELPTLLELKTLHFGSSTYGHGPCRCDAVDRRARALQGEYANKAREVDRRYCDTLEGDTGPVTTHLRSFGDVKGLVFGAWGETSPDVERLLALLARRGAALHWRALDCQDENAAKGILAWMLRRRWGLTALRECARLKLERLAFVGRGAGAAAERRLRSEPLHLARAYCGPTAGGPSGVCA